MSDNKSGGLDQYGKVQKLNVVGGERVNIPINACHKSFGGGIDKQSAALL